MLSEKATAPRKECRGGVVRNWCMFSETWTPSSPAMHKGAQACLSAGAHKVGSAQVGSDMRFVRFTAARSEPQAYLATPH